MKKTVLIIERDRDIREVVTLILTDQGMNVIELDSEADALESIIKMQPDCVILDLQNPTEEGAKLCMEINQHPETKDIPVIALSTHPRAVELKGTCANEVLGKPFDIDALIEIVESQLAD